MFKVKEGINLNGALITNPSGTLTCSIGVSVINNTSAPTELSILNNSSSSSAQGSLRVGYDAANCMHIFRVGNLSDIYFDATQNGPIHFQGGGTDRALLTSSGLTVTGQVASGYGSFATPAIAIGDAQYGIYAVAGALYIKSSSNTNVIFRNSANTGNNFVVNDAGILIGTREAATPSTFGYSSSYKTLILGSTSTDYSTTGVTLSLGQNTLGITGSTYQGDGREIIVRRLQGFMIPNAAGTNWEPLMSWNGQTISMPGAVTTGTLTTSSLTETSSIAFKENVNPITNALDTIMQLCGVTYDRIDNHESEAGLIAEDVNLVLPNLVSKNSNGDPHGVKYTKIIAYLIESIKELKQEINQLKGQ